MSKFYLRWLGIVIALSWQLSALADAPLKILASQWGVYQGAFPDFLEGSNFGLSSRVRDLEAKIGRNLALVTYQNDWVDGAYFPWDAIDQISGMNRTPYIRILPRSTRTQNAGGDPYYSMESFLRGYHDNVLREWARNARLSATPLMVEFAPEANGRWYPWNGLWNGAGETRGYGDPNLADGPERYRDAYRRVVDIFRAEGATNVTWVFHVDSQPQPQEPWNTMAAYYPGDDYIDWIGVSVFGAQYPWDYWDSFTNVLDNAYPELAALSATKPLAVVEFGVIEDDTDSNHKAQWIQGALQSIIDGRYPRIKAINYWSEHSWIRTRNNDLRIDSSPQALYEYSRLIKNDLFLSDLEVTWH